MKFRDPNDVHDRNDDTADNAKHAENADIDDDFATARKNLHQIIHKGNDALEEALLVAKSSEHPRAFEVVGGLIKTLVDANKDLLDIQKKLKDLKKSDDEKAPQSVQDKQSTKGASKTEDGNGPAFEEVPDIEPF